MNTFLSVQNVFIGDNVEIIADDSLEYIQTENYVIRKEIIVLMKGAKIPSGTKIGFIS